MAKSVVINGVTYSDVPEVEIPLSSGSGNAVFYDPSDADAAVGDVLTGKTFYKDGGKAFKPLAIQTNYVDIIKEEK